MTQRVLVIGHADADGHLIAEQVRRNLSMIKGFDVTVIVDPTRTRDHRVWKNLNSIVEIDAMDLVFFVDMMFAPSSFDDEAAALVKFVSDRPGKRFFLIDHHPLPLRRLSAADNLRVIYRPQVFECAFGPRSGMMVVAALCEKQRADVADIIEPSHEVIAAGMRRAAALGGNLPGDGLLTLLRHDQWSSLASLGGEASELHWLPRGRRPVGQPVSQALAEAAAIAADLSSMIERASGTRGGKGSAMAYDMEIADQRFSTENGRRQRLGNAVINPKDLEAIVTILEVAALSLTTGIEATFTIRELVAEAKDLAGEELDLDEGDIAIVLKKANFIDKVGRDQWRLR